MTEKRWKRGGCGSRQVVASTRGRELSSDTFSGTDTCCAIITAPMTSLSQIFLDLKLSRPFIKILKLPLPVLYS